ncbi:hypothetical protein [Pseudonocardia sp. 73-21]|uniref:hypothetical protein n=1 Tax=Pseudonocardia sp. 73-21 TaxID=1895809 RepID=UPI002625021C|nr:hypothetical protein [Pseudonocardia sp. 73-21]
MQVAIVTFDGFNELDSFIASAMINRAPGLTAYITTPTRTVTSLNGVEVLGQRPLGFVTRRTRCSSGAASAPVTSWPTADCSTP